MFLPLLKFFEYAVRYVAYKKPNLWSAKSHGYFKSYEIFVTSLPKI